MSAVAVARNALEQCSCCIEKRDRGEIESADIKKICAPIVGVKKRRDCVAQYLCALCLLEQAESLLQLEFNGEDDDEEEGRLIIVNPINSTQKIDWVESGLADYDPNVNARIPNGLPAFLFVNFGLMLSRKHPFLTLTEEGVREKNEGYCKTAIALFDEKRTEAQRQAASNSNTISTTHPSCCPDCESPVHRCMISSKQLLEAGLTADAFKVCCTKCTKKRATERVDKHGDIGNDYMIEDAPSDAIDLFKNEKIAFNEHVPLPSPEYLRFPLQVIPNPDMNVDTSTADGKANVLKMFSVFATARMKEKKRSMIWNRRYRAQKVEASAAMGDAPDLDDDEFDAALKLCGKSAKDLDYVRGEDLLDLNRCSVVVIDDKVEIQNREQYRKTTDKVDTPLVRGDGTLLQVDGGMISFATVGKDEKYVAEDDDSTAPTVRAIAKIICDPASHSSMKRLEEATQANALKDKELRPGCLNNDSYRPGLDSRTVTHGVVCLLLLKGSLKAVFDENVDVYLNYDMAPDIKNRLRLLYPELNEAKYWRHEVTGARARKRKCYQERRDGKKQKTEE